MPVEAPTPLVHIMRVKEKRKRQVRAPKSNRKSVPSGRGSPRWMIKRRDWDKGVKKTCSSNKKSLHGCASDTNHSKNQRIDTEFDKNEIT